MTSYQAGELVLVEFPLTGGGTPVKRPALVLLDPGDADVVVARVTTKPHMTALDVPITPWPASGLLASSVVLHKLATLEKKLVHKALGKLQPTDRAAVAVVLHRVYGTW